MSEAAIRLHMSRWQQGGYVATSPIWRDWWRKAEHRGKPWMIAQGWPGRWPESCLEHGDPLPPSLARLVDGGISDFIHPGGNFLDGPPGGVQSIARSRDVCEPSVGVCRPGPGSHGKFGVIQRGRRVTVGRIKIGGTWPRATLRRHSAGSRDRRRGIFFGSKPAQEQWWTGRIVFSQNFVIDLTHSKTSGY